MFSLIFHCGLISSVVSAHLNNDTLHDGDELDINTTLSTLVSTTIPVSTDCVLEMKENEISQIVELFNSNLVNVVVIPISFSNRSQNKQLLTDFHVSLSNPIGREILYAHQSLVFGYVTWTLKAGIRFFKLNVNGSQNDCIKTEKNATDFVLDSTQHIVDTINLATNYQVCSSFKETLPGKANQNYETCCQITKPFLATKFNYKCPIKNSILFESGLPLVVVCMTLVIPYYYFTWLLSVLLSRTEFNLEYPEYYKLEESLMSPSSILLKVFWDENGRVVSFIRRLVLVGACSYFCYLQGEILDLYFSSYLAIIFPSILVFWELPFLVSNLLRPRMTNSAVILNKIKQRRNSVLPRNQFFWHNLGTSWENGKRGDFEIVVSIIISLFNPNVWRNIIKMLYNKCRASARCVIGQFRNSILKTLALCAYSVLALLVCFAYVCVLFLYLITFAISCLIAHLWNLLLLVCSLEYRTDNFFNRALSIFHTLCLICWPLISLQIIILSIVSFLLGLFLNLIYFIPYFAFFSVLTFYCCTYWKTMEEKYFVLKQLIYEACRETQEIRNGSILNRHPEPDKKVLPVVSKKLYDKITEELLPYDTNLFYFGLKMVWSIAFSLGIFALINMLNKFNVTGLVQVVTTASVGIMPHILNMVALKTSEARTKAKNENFKLNIKNMVEELIGQDQKLARTVLKIEQEDDVIIENNAITDDENTEDSEHFETMFGINFSDNEDVEDVEAARTVTIRRNDKTTTDENVQNSENAHVRFESNPHNDDVEDDELLPNVLVHSHRNHETTTVENVQNSEIVHASFELNSDNDDVEDDEIDPTVLVDRNHEGTTSENSRHVHAILELRAIDNDDVKDNDPASTVIIPRDDESKFAENVQLRSSANVQTMSDFNPENDDVENDGLSPTVKARRNRKVTNNENVQTFENAYAKFEANHDSYDIEDDELSPTLIVCSSRKVTNNENVQTSENVNTMRSNSNPDHGGVQDDELAQAVIVRSNGEAKIHENVYAMSDLNADNDDEDNGMAPTVVAHGNGKATINENIHSRFDPNLDNDDVKEDELAPIVVVHRNDETNDKHDENSENVHSND